jgi:dTDP-4-dehydrorhamnose 3,5-epimerase-like enzyme
MALYPVSLLPRKAYSLLANEEILDNTLVRETTANLYLLLGKKGYTPDDILPFIVAPQPSLREVFELSLFLYGYYDEQHCGIRVNDKTLYADWTVEQPELAAETIQFIQENAWPLFLAAQKLDRQVIDFNGEDHLLSFSHKPTRVNYWHFELWIKDSVGVRIPRGKNNAHAKYLAKSLLEYIITEAVVLKTEVKPFKRPDFYNG